MADGGSFLARPLSVVSGERGRLEGIGGQMGTVPCRFSKKVPVARYLPVTNLKSAVSTT